MICLRAFTHTGNHKSVYWLHYLTTLYLTTYNWVTTKNQIKPLSNDSEKKDEEQDEKKKLKSEQIPNQIIVYNILFKTS